MKRRIRRVFPSELTISPKFAYALGLIKGEGANSLGKSNYRRFTFTNSDPGLVVFVLKELEAKGIIDISSLPNHCLHLLHFKKLASIVLDYWSNSLNLPISKFKIFEDKNKTSDFGVCHLYLNDALLRRFIDLLIEQVQF